MRGLEWVIQHEGKDILEEKGNGFFSLGGCGGRQGECLSTLYNADSL
jgi:hypothetical protein